MVSSGMNFELYTKSSFEGIKADSVVAQFPCYTMMLACMDSFIRIFGDNLYARALTQDGRELIGVLSHPAKTIMTITNSRGY